MKKFIILALLMTSTAAFAADASTAAAPDKATAMQAKFDHSKAARLKKITDHIATLQKAQACVDAATDYNGLATCNSPTYKAYKKKHAAAAPADAAGK